MRVHMIQSFIFIANLVAPKYIYTSARFLWNVETQIAQKSLAIQRQFGRANWVRFTSLGWFRKPSWWGLKKTGLNCCKHEVSGIMKI